MNKIFVLTLFPEAVMGVLSGSIIGNAIKNGIVDIQCIQIRDYTQNRQMQVDDYPYGGGMGMLLMADPLYRAWKAAADQCKHPHTILMSAQGQPYAQHAARRLSLEHELIFVCGHYEGVDQRFIDECVDEEISLGDFVLTGGEIAACAIADAVCRMVKGVLSDDICFTEESHFASLLEYPQYTRPPEWHGAKVPDVLLSGHHANIEKWRREMSLAETAKRRPDMLQNAELTEKDKKYLLSLNKKD